MTSPSKSREVGGRLNHPVIDSDGHTIEFEPAVLDYFVKVGGVELVQRFMTEWNNPKGLRGGSSLYGWGRLTPGLLQGNGD